MHAPLPVNYVSSMHRLGRHRLGRHRLGGHRLGKHRLGRHRLGGHRLPWSTVLLLPLVLSVGCGGEPRHDTDRAPNVLLVTMDSVRADALSCYGHAAGSTPSIDVVAEEGIRFDRCLATSEDARVSLASIHTGHNSVTPESSEAEALLSKDFSSLPQALAQLGWRTAAFLSSDVVGRRSVLGSSYQTFVSSKGNGSKGNGSKGNGSEGSDPEGSGSEGNASKSWQRSDITTSNALTWLEEHAELGPWHLWVHYCDLADEALPPPDDFLLEEERDLDLEQGSAARYALGLRYMDSQVGRLTEWLRRSGNFDDTIILLVANRGMWISEPGQGEAPRLSEAGLHVPMIMLLPAEEAARYPATERGRVVTEQVRTIDLLPTVLELLELSEFGSGDGRSLIPLLRRELDEPRLAFAYAPASQAQGPLFMVSDQLWKLLTPGTGVEAAQLYDLEADPAASVNVIDEHRDVAARLQRALVEYGVVLDPGASR